jgi:hypothetical protein
MPTLAAMCVGSWQVCEHAAHQAVDCRKQLYKRLQIITLGAAKAPCEIHCQPNGSDNCMRITSIMTSGEEGSCTPIVTRFNEFLSIYSLDLKARHRAQRSGFAELFAASVKKNMRAVRNL